MKASELFAEQLLIGLVVLFIGVTLMYGDFLSVVTAGKGNSDSAVFTQVIFSTFIVAAAYLIGILYDRCADTLLEDVEQYDRLKFAFTRLSGKEIAELKKKNALKKDPFPSQDIRLRILMQGGEVAEYADYLRSRIRLTRSLATLMPALFFALLVETMALQRYTRAWLGLCVALLYGMTLLSKVFSWEKNQDKPPKTHKVNLHNTYEKGHIKIEPNPKTGKDEVQLAWRRGAFLGDTAVWGAFLMTLLALGVAAVAVAEGRSWTVLLYPVGGAIASLLAGWVWLRISKTFHKLQDRYQWLADKKEGLFPAKDA